MNLARFVVAFAVVVTPTCSLAQSVLDSHVAPTPAAATAPTVVPALVPYSGNLESVPGIAVAGEQPMTFLLFTEEQGGEPLWVESQLVMVDATGHYTANLGASSPSGLPLNVFATGQGRWLEVQSAGHKPSRRVLLMSVPYAMKSADSATLGGLPASAFALAGSVPSRGSITNGVTPNVSSAVTTLGGTSGYLSAFTGASTIGNSVIFQSGNKLGINTTGPAATLDVNGSVLSRGFLHLLYSGAATPSAGTNSQPLDFITSLWNSSSAKVVEPYFQLQAEPTANNTATPGATFNFLYDNGTTLAETGLYVNSAGILHFAAGQTFPITGVGTITGVKAGTDLTGGGTSGSVTLNLDTTKIPQLAVSNNFTGTQTITNGMLNLSPTTAPLIGAIYIGGIPFLHGYNSGKRNVFVGGAGNFSTTGTENSGTGSNALLDLTSGFGNTATGEAALLSTTTGASNTAVGASALSSNSTGSNNTSIGALSGPSVGTLTNTTALGYESYVSQSNSLVLGHTAASSPGTAFVNVGVGTSAPRSILEIAQSVTGGMGPVFSLTNPAGQSGAAAAIDFNTSTPVNGAANVPNAEIRASDAGGFTDNLLFYANKQGAINNGYELNMEIAATGQVSIGTTGPTGEAQLIVVQNENQGGAIQAFAETVPTGEYAGWGGAGIKASGGNSTGNLEAGVGGQFIGGNNYENGYAGDGLEVSAGIGGATPGLGEYINGDLFVFGNITNGTTFSGPLDPAIAGTTIDHPLDPVNKYLTLASVESPEMTSVISGNVITDELGFATVTIPEWFDAMHGDFRYQLTVVGGRFAQAIVSKEIEKHQFTINTNATRVKVSWQVTAVRQDAYAKAHPLIVEEEKKANERGFYKNPEVYGQPEEKQMEWAHHPASMKKMRDHRIAAQTAYATGNQPHKEPIRPTSGAVASAAPKPVVTAERR